MTTWRRLAIVLLVALVVPLGIASWLDAVPAECAAVQQMAVPLSDDAMAALRVIADRADEVMGRTDYHMTSFGIDETRGVVAVGSSQPTADMCRDLHARYGPYIEVTKQAPITLFS
jgi:hypothetical protein